MSVELRDLEDLATVEVETENGRATLRELRTENRFDAVRASAEWQSSSSDRWGRVRTWGFTYIAALYEKVPDAIDATRTVLEDTAGVIGFDGEGPI